MTEVLYRPSRKLRERSRLGEFIDWLATARGVEVDGYDALHTWSVTEIESFWTAVWDYFEVKGHAPHTRVLSGTMPDARWFSGATLNYAEHCLGADPASVALVGYSQTREPVSLTFADLAEQVRRARNGLRRLGVTAGDRVVAYAPNIPETVVAFLATASLGAVWASVAPEFGAPAVVDRLGQLTPTVLITIGGYQFGAKPVDKAADVATVRAGLPTLKHIVTVPYGNHRTDGLPWPELLDTRDETPLAFNPVPFDHPLYVLFSSGTTGMPKPLTHGHGGILLEHLKTTHSTGTSAPATGCCGSPRPRG